MKKLLSLLGGVSLVATTSASVVACGNTTTKPEKIDYNRLIKDLEKDVNNIFVEHLENNVYKNLIGLTINEKENKFLNRTTIKIFKGKPASEIGEKNLALLVEDISNILELKELESKLNELKLVNKYNILLNDVNTLYKGIVFDWNTLDINSNESNDIYLANVLLNYKIEVQYKGEKEIEVLRISESFKYTLTNEEKIKNSSDNFYKNITKDYFSTQDLDAQKYSNLLWNDIKGSKSKLDGYGDIEKEIDNYWNNTAKQNGFTDSITEFIKANYFNELPTLPLIFETDNFYKSTVLNETSLFNSINKPKALEDYESIKFDYKTEVGQLMLESIFRKNPDISPTDYLLRSNYFTEKNLDVWTKDYKLLKEEFIKKLNGNLEEFEKTEQYKSSFSMGHVNLTGLSINFPDDKYIHYLPDFKIAINYIIDLNQSSDEILNDLNEFSVNSIKAFHEVYGVDYDYDYLQKNNSEEDILMAIKKSDFTNSIKFEKDSIGGVSLINKALSLDINETLPYREKLLKKSNLPLDSIYLFDFRNSYSSSDSPSMICCSKYFRNYDSERGVFFNIYNLNNNTMWEAKQMYWNLGYLNLHFDLDKIMDGIKTLEEKDFIVFS
ncbi:lipoprotein [Spiroplasma endosymbiont of Cantharis lateralis]|uniref:lipoprotein n=1 Tax=Spiroplasma endosymbiont of Cantharis lateralis TaxID=3066277 RepID=UPI00313AE9B5